MKNIDFKTLLFSKTFWGALGALMAGLAMAYADWKKGNQAQALTTLIGAFSLFLTAIGIKDATSGPVN